MSNYYIIKASDTNRWKELLAKLKSVLAQKFYYHAEFIRLYQRPNSLVEAFVFEEEQDCFFFPYIKSRVNPKYTGGKFLSVIETAYGYGGPLSTSSTGEFPKRAWASFLLHCREQNIIAGFIRYDPISKNFNYFHPEEMSPCKDREVIVLELDKGEEDIWLQYDSSVRNKIRKAMKSDVIIEFLEMDDERDPMAIFESMYRETMDRVNACEFYYFSEEYFRCIKTELKEFARIFLAKHNGEYVGGILFFEHEGVLAVHLSACQSQKLSLGVPSLLRHHVITYGLKKKIKVINFGGGITGSPEDPLFRYKSGFSKQRADYCLGKMVFDRNKYEETVKCWENFNQEPRFYSGFHLKFLHEEG